jgi:superfamily II DNA/RNA helicase
VLSPSINDEVIDQADRMTDSGYTYDLFGRTTTVPPTDAGGTQLDQKMRQRESA